MVSLPWSTCTTWRRRWKLWSFLFSRFFSGEGFWRSIVWTVAVIQWTYQNFLTCRFRKYNVYIFFQCDFNAMWLSVMVSKGDESTWIDNCFRNEMLLFLLFTPSSLVRHNATFVLTPLRYIILQIQRTKSLWSQ